MARTMSDERLAAIRFVLGREPEHVQKNAKALLAELDAERAAHGETIASLNQERSAHEETKAKWSEGYERLWADLTALKARLALAEAVCESCSEDWDDEFGGFDVYDHDALTAWRAAK